MITNKKQFHRLLLNHRALIFEKIKITKLLNLKKKNRAAKNLTDRPNENEITGSTLAPNFPKLVIKKPKNLNGPFFFDDVVNIR